MKDLKGFERFLRNQTTSESTISSRIGDINIFFKTHRKITTETVQTFVTEMIERNLNPYTVSRKVSSIKKYCEYANILLGKIYVPKTHRKIPRILSAEEVKKIFDAAMNIHVDNGFNAMTVRTFIILFNYLIRRQGVLDIEESDIDFDSNNLYIHNKGGDTIVKPLFVGVKELKEYINLKRNIEINETKLLVYKYNNEWKPLKKRELYKMLYDFTESVIGKKVNPHMFRHSIATAMLDHGADIRKVQELLDHKKIETTQFYTQVSTAAKEKTYGLHHPIFDRG